MDFATAAGLLRERFQDYLNYITEHPEFAAHKPMFILALGVGTGSASENEYTGIVRKLATGYMRASAEAMVRGVDRGSGFQVEPFYDDRYQHKYISFVLAFDNEFKKHSYQREIFNNFMNANSELLRRGYYQIWRRPEDPVLPDINEPRGVAPSAQRDKVLRHVMQDIYRPSMGLTPNPFDPEKPPNFYNIFFVGEDLPTLNRNNNYTKYRALRNTSKPRTFNAVIEGCEIAESYPLIQIQDILNKIIEMGGIIGVQNDAYWMSRGLIGSIPENYYFENMCEIPKLLSEYPPHQVYRFEMNPFDLIATPFFSSIPEVHLMKKFDPLHRSYWSQLDWVVTNVNRPSNYFTGSQVQQNTLPPEPSWSKGHWVGERWVPNARKGGATKRHFIKRRFSSSRKQTRKSIKKRYS